MTVTHIIISDDAVSINDTVYPLRDYVITANGVEIDPKNLPGWFNAALKSGSVVLDKSVLHCATLSLVQL